MFGSHYTMIAELESLHGLQERIDRVAQDLLFGERRYAAINAEKLGGSWAWSLGVLMIGE